MTSTAELIDTTDIVSSMLLTHCNAEHNIEEQKQFKSFVYPLEYQKASVTERKLYDLFVVPVDRNICDSGSVYGCKNDYNRKRNLFVEPCTYFDITRLNDGQAWFNIYVNTFRLLCKCLKYNAKEDMRFQEWYQQHDNWLDAIEHEDCTFKPQGYFGSSWRVYNSYNDESSRLDNVIQYAKYPYERYCGYDRDEGDIDSNWMIVQIHGGCDVRSGYSAPVLFQLVDEEKFNWESTEAAMYCTKCAFAADYSFDSAEIWSVPKGQEDYLNERPEKVFPCKAGNIPEKGAIICTEDGQLLCPFCGGRLSVDAREMC